MKLAIDILEGEYIPTGYAIAYRDFNRDVKIAYPIPIHFFVRWGRDLLFWCRTVGRPGFKEKHEQRIFLLGQADGEKRAERYIKASEVNEARAYQRGWNAAIQSCLDDLAKEKAK